MRLLDHLGRQLAEREAQDARRRVRVSCGPCAPRMCVDGPAGESRELLAFCSNDYLGLANHPALVDAWAEGARRHGVGSGASHLISGHSQAHALLEAELARWQAPHIPGGARALCFSTGYMANLAVLAALGSSQATLFCDKLNHASLVDGAQLAAARMQRYPHADLDRLAHFLGACDTPFKFIVTDSVFSMDGSVADLPALLRLAQAHDAWLVVDDAHGFGVLGERGRGCLAHFDVSSERILYVGTLGKAAGVAGAFVVAHPVIADWLLNTARSYIYTTASPPAQAHAVLASLRLIESGEGDVRRGQLSRLIHQLREPLSSVAGKGWEWAPSHTPIQPLRVGANAEALALSAALERLGLWVPAIRPPTVPAGTARLRVSLSAAHTLEDVGRLRTALAEVAVGAEAVPR